MSNQESVTSVGIIRYLRRTIDWVVEDALINCIIGSRVRARQIFSLYEPSQSVALDCGCATGSDLKVLIKKGCITVGLDLNPALLKKAKSRIPDSLLVVGDATYLPFRDRGFDFILCSDVLEHIPEDGRTLEEIYRILSNDGVFALTVPIEVERRWVWRIRRIFGLNRRFWMSFYAHVREGYRFNVFTELLSRTGFSIDRVGFCYGIFSNFIESLVIGVMKKTFKKPSQVRSFNMEFSNKLLLVIYRLIFPLLLAFAYLDFLVPSKNLKSDVVVILRKHALDQF